MDADPPICTFYLQNNCKRGDSCSFSHQKPASGQKPLQSPICKYFIQGKCAYGAKCPRSHTAKARTKSTTSSSGNASDTKIKKRAPALRTAAVYDQRLDQPDVASEREGDDVTSQPDTGWGPQLTKETRQTSFEQPFELKSPCIFYSQGECDKLGDECEFSHSDPFGTAHSPSRHQKPSSKISPTQPRERAKTTFNLNSIRRASPTYPPPVDLDARNFNGTNEYDKVASEVNDNGSEAGLEYVDSHHGNEDPQNEQRTMPHAEHADFEWKENSPSHRSYPESRGEENQGDRYDPRPVEDEPKSRYLQQDRRPRAPGSYYGEGWEERSVVSPPSPPPNTSHQHKVPHETVKSVAQSYPHVSEVKPHWSQFADPLANSQVPFCKPHAQGQCIMALGDSCRFRHSLTPTEYTLLFLDQQPNLWTLERGPKVPPTNGFSHHPIVLQPTPLHPSKQVYEVSETPHFPDLPDPPVRNCTFYPLGKCKNGDICPYRHIGPPVAPDTAPLSSDQDRGAATRYTNFDQLRTKKPCHFFTSRGYCHRGDSCQFSHGDADSPPSSGPSGPQSSDEPVNENEKEEDDNGWKTTWHDNTQKNDDWNAKEADNDDWTAKKPDADGWNTTKDPDIDIDSWGIPKDHSGWGGFNDSQTQARTTVTTTATRSKQGACHRFAQSGHCRFGDQCRFAHDAEPTKPTSWDSPKREEWPATDNSFNSAPRDSSARQFTVSGSVQSRNENNPENEAGPSRQREVYQDQNDMRHNSWTAEGEGYRHSGEDEIYAPHEAYEEVHEDNQEEDSQSVNQEIPSTQIDLDLEPAHSVGADQEEEPETNLDLTVLDDQQVSDQELESSLAPIVFDHPDVTRFMMNCEVSFGPDSTPNSVATSSDTRKLLLSNLPVDVSPTDIKRLAEPHGVVQHVISLDETDSSATIEVQFAEVGQALTAFKHLNGITFESRVITASLNARIPFILRSRNEKLVLKVSWPNPSLSSWAHYQTITKAKSEAARLNDIIVRGRNIKAVFVTPNKNQKDSFAIKIDRLPLDVTKADLEDLCPESTTISMNRPTYSADATQTIRSIFDGFGGSFEILPGCDLQVASVAFVTFKNEAIVDEVIQSLESKKQDCLGQQTLTIRPVHYFRYRISSNLFEATKNELDRLIEKCDKKCTIQFSDHRDKTLKFIRIHALFEHDELFAGLNGQLWQLLHGVTLKHDDGREVWDDYFELPSCAKAFKRLQDDTNAFICCDYRNKQVRVYGSQSQQVEARKLIFKLLSTVHSQRHEIDLPRPKLHALVNGTFATLQTDIGINKVSLDLINSKFVVRGNEADVSKANMVLDSLATEAEALTDLEKCQICHRNPVNILTLSCHHKYCSQCLQSVVVQIGRAPFPCISKRILPDGQTKLCSGYVPYILARDILGAREKDILHASFCSHVRSRPDELFFCPSLDCQAAYRVGGEGVNVKCNLCLTDICTHCRSPAHLGLDCQERVGWEQI